MFCEKIQESGFQRLEQNETKTVCTHTLQRTHTKLLVIEREKEKGLHYHTGIREFKYLVRFKDIPDEEDTVMMRNT